MSDFAKPTRTNLIPCLQYRDAPAAIAWLQSTFGFSEHLVVPNDQGGIAHAQLCCGNGMLMLGSANAQSEYGRLMRQPQQAGGNTQSIYVVIERVDALYARAKAAGAEIVIEVRDEDYGGRGFSCRDLEGHLWNFGSYDPWEDTGSGS
ncbi:VOC family protein [Pseudomonas sp. UL073]|uniref:VOC family protein n=1 Tax=Zestomonas insulae TaxID=2809017 RepID=A0ABS2ICN7_9GAMM|nr:VOC family protein [Pseudomonas insulae]MBM7060433.1 VOC family protein [Pseudomonas insulae]